MKKRRAKIKKRRGLRAIKNDDGFLTFFVKGDVYDRFVKKISRQGISNSEAVGSVLRHFMYEFSKGPHCRN